MFGAAGRRIYANDNVLIGYPLAWQYLTVLRSDAVPSSADELIYARAAGWRAWYSVGTPGYARGVPLTTAFRYDTGVQARVGGEHQRVSVAAAVTAGTLSSPGARTTNGGPQISTRLAVRPATGLILAGSFADGRFFADDLAVPQPLDGSGSGYTYTTTSTRDGPLPPADLGRRRGVLARAFSGARRAGDVPDGACPPLARPRSTTVCDRRACRSKAAIASRRA